MGTTGAVIFMIALAAFAEAAEPAPRFARMLHVPNSPEVVVITEGEFEGRGSGSYSLRIYGGLSRKYPLDDFIAGAVRPRKGVIERVLVDAVDHNAIEIVVVIRSVGTGGYLSADFFRYRAKSLVWVASVAGLDKRADPLVALREKSKQQLKQ
jgi:hypothetical protein